MEGSAVTLGGYKARKAAQVAAFFAIKSGGTVNVLKLMKLMYLSEREFISRYDFPMLFDRLVSMKNGPVMSKTLNLINGEEINSGEWNEFVRDRENHEIGLAIGRLTIEDLDEISDAELEVLQATWQRFGKLNQWELVSFTHRNCPEWENPGESSVSIPYERLLRYLGRENADQIADEISTMRDIAKSLSYVE